LCDVWSGGDRVVAAVVISCGPEAVELDCLVLDEDIILDDDIREQVQDLINNTKLSEGYLTFARDIEVMEPKSPEDIYKEHLLDGRASASAGVESARQNLAATFVNAFVNAGFGEDKLMIVASEAGPSEN
ncbi:26S proteasome non-ATPase regulatory subunit 2 A, partial [Dionaea muscipula]